MAHAKLSPSSAHRWMLCTGSVAMEEGLPESSSEYADWGTAAHFLAAKCLEQRVAPDVHASKKIVLWEHPESSCYGVDFDVQLMMSSEPFDVVATFAVDPDMIDCVQAYIDNVRQYAEGHTLMVEQPVQIGLLTGEEGACGTADAIVLTNDGKELQVHDLKTGRGEQVEAEENYQLMLYALGALEAVSLLGAEPEIVRLVIHQPRLNHFPEWDTTVTALREWAATLNVRSAAAKATLDKVRAGGKVFPEELHAGDKQCRWCKAKATCPAAAQRVLSTVADEFVDMTQPVIPQIEGAIDHVSETDTPRLAEMLQQVDFIEGWCKAVRARVESELLAGRPVPGFKLVAGRAGARKWSSEDEAEKLLKSMRLKKEEMYDFKLISPTSAEKLLKETPKRWERVQPLITRSDGAPSVAPESDKRPAISAGPDLAGFEELA